MGLVIGMDEAGYGPNLGPLVVSASVWEVPGSPGDIDLWDVQEDAITQAPVRNDSRLHVADSKSVYTPARGIGSLERSVLAALSLSESAPKSFRELWSLLADDTGSSPEDEPWFCGQDLPLPQTKLGESYSVSGDRWRSCCDRHDIRLRCIASDIVLTERFNRLTREYDSKGVALSRISMKLLRRVWSPEESQQVLVVADKHGGRNRYDQLLSEVLDGRMILRGEEGRERSVYRVGETEIRFQMKAESHFPVAIASMVSKYTRELAMELFNRFWGEHVEGLKPTKGYPVDARRFKQDIADAQQQLGISDEMLWRER